MSREWSPYQTAIFDAVADMDGGSIVVVARAGSGKTTTLIESADRAPIRGRMAIVAFAQRSKARVNDARPPKHFDVSTLHSMGLTLLRGHNPRLKVDNEGAKLREVVAAEFPHSFPKRMLLFPLVKAAKTRLVDKPGTIAAMAVQLDTAGVLAKKADIDEMVAATLSALFVCRERDELIDFDDMIWMPVELGLSAARYRFLFVDELQDMTRAQVALVASVCQDGRAVGFGDPAQAIYQFAGADADAVDELATRTNARTLPLSISYRCPLAVLEEARAFVPDIEARPGAPDGLVDHESSLARVRPGDLVISRTNAPLMKQCLAYIRSGVPAYIAGRSSGDDMVKLVERSRCDSVREFLGFLDRWAKVEVARLELVDKPSDHVADRVECFRAVAEGCPSIAELLSRIRRLFTEVRGEAVVLSTVHQMKGDEFDRVFVLADTFRLSREKFDSAPAAYRGTEEANLHYVAITRAKAELHYVRGIK